MSPEFPDSGALDPSVDERLVLRCLAGEESAWQELVRRHERLVYAVARSYRLSEADLGDVFQDVFAALVQGLPRLREPRALVRWLASTAERIARATALRRRREAALSTPDAEVSLTRVGGPQPPVGADLERLEEQALIRLALESLAPRCRELLQALYYEDPAPTYSELSRRFRLPIGSLGPTRGRCFERLRQALAQLSAMEVGISAARTATYSPEHPSHGRARPAPGRRRGAYPMAEPAV